MEFSTFHSDLAGTDIKPNVMLAEYIALLEQDNKTFFPESMLKDVDCPACGSKQRTSLVSKFGLNYATCGDCNTIYVSRRPQQDTLMRFAQESAARRFWLRELWSKTAAVRHDKILEPLKEWVETMLSEAFNGTRSIPVADFNANNWGFWETLTENGSALQVDLVEPMFDASLRPTTQAGIQPSTTKKTYKAVCLMETLGRVEDPMAALNWAESHLENGGLCFITTVLSTGFDVQVLGAKSDALIPPDRLNLLSFEGLQKLIAKTGFSVVEMSTPGVLDLQNVQRAIAQGIEVPSFVRYMVQTRGADPRFQYDFQTFLQSNGLSSQGRVVLRKTTEEMK